MSALPDLPAGVYQHYKGPLYLALGYGHDANADEFYESNTLGDLPSFPDGRTVVVYVGLELDGAKKGARLAVRTAEDFHGWVNPATGESVVTPLGGTEQRRAWRQGARPRFRYLGPTFEGKPGAAS